MSPFIQYSRIANHSRIFFTLPLLFFWGLTATAQPLQILWQQCYGGNGEDFGTSIQPSPTGYYLFGGTTSNDGDVHGNHGKSDLWLVSIDSSGNYLNSICFGGSDDEEPRFSYKFVSGGYILGSTTFSTDGNITNNHGGGDYWVIKTDDNSNLIWQKCFGGSCNDIMGGLSLTKDSGILCCGLSCSTNGDATGNHGVYDYWVVKVDKNSNLIWEKSLGGTHPDVGAYATETNDGGIIACGWTGSSDGDVNCQPHSQVDAWVIKLDSLHNTEWEKCYGGSKDDIIDQIIPLADGTYLFMGITYSSDGDIHNQHGQGDFWVGKIDHFGKLLWNNCYGGSDLDYPLFIKQVSDGDYIIGGYTLSFDDEVTDNHSLPGYSDMWFIKISANGDLIWEQCFGGELDDILNDAIELPDHRFLLQGYTRTSNNSGDVHCYHHGAGTHDQWLLMVYDSTTVGIPSKTPGQIEIIAYPNPAKNIVTFAYNSNSNNLETEIIILDQVGRKIDSFIVKQEDKEVNWRTNGISPGVYFYQYRCGQVIKTKKIILL